MMNVIGELVFDTSKLAILRDRKDRSTFYALDKNKHDEGQFELRRRLREAHLKKIPFICPEVEVIPLIEKEKGKYDLDTTTKSIPVDTLKGVLIGH